MATLLGRWTRTARRVHRMLSARPTAAPTVAQSTIWPEVELCAASSVCFEGRPLRHFIEWAGMNVHGKLHADSSSAEAVARALWPADLEHGGERYPADLGAKSHTSVTL